MHFCPEMAALLASVVAGSLDDYAIARAGDLPSFEISHHATPAFGTPAGINGMAEGGTMGAISAVMNAVNDALARIGAHLPAQPAMPAQTWWALLRRDNGNTRPICSSVLVAVC